MSSEDIKILIGNIEKVIVGKTETIKLLLVGLLTNGHILIEDVPGLGKTMLTLALAKSISGDFKRIQFTPDLLPSDVTGGFVYSAKTGEFDPIRTFRVHAGIQGYRRGKELFFGPPLPGGRHAKPYRVSRDLSFT